MKLWDCTFISVSRFQSALKMYGVDDRDLFQTNDLSEKKDMANVTGSIYP